MTNGNFEWEHEPALERPPAIAEASAISNRSTATWAEAWELKRGVPHKLDFGLTTLTIAWAAAMPATLRPLELCLQYPRIANRLALAWPDAVLAKRVLENVVADRRGGRRGFPKEVSEELSRLLADVGRLRAREGR